MTLDQCGDTLGIAELLAVLGIKKSKFHELKRHGMLPDPLPGLSGRYSKAAIDAYLKGAYPKRLRRSA